MRAGFRSFFVYCSLPFSKGQCEDNECLSAMSAQYINIYDLLDRRDELSKAGVKQLVPSTGLFAYIQTSI